MLLRCYCVVGETIVIIKNNTWIQNIDLFYFYQSFCTWQQESENELQVKMFIAQMEFVVK